VIPHIGTSPPGTLIRIEEAVAPPGTLIRIEEAVAPPTIRPPSSAARARSSSVA